MLYLHDIAPLIDFTGYNNDTPPSTPGTSIMSLSNEKYDFHLISIFGQYLKLKRSVGFNVDAIKTYESINENTKHKQWLRLLDTKKFSKI